MSAAPPASKRSSRSAAEDYRGKILHESSGLARTLRRSGYPAPLGDAASGVMLVVEDPVGPRLIEALERSLEAVSLPDAYVTWASTGLLLQEVLTIQPSALAAIGPNSARELDALGYPLSRNSFAEAAAGTWFPWTRSTSGILLPALAPALEDEGAKKRFWRSFLALRVLNRPSP